MLTAYVAAGALAVGALAGWHVQGWRRDAADNERIAAEQRDTLRRMDKADAAAVSHEQTKVKIQERIRYVTREVDRIVERPLYRDGVCFDDAGLRAVADAIGAATGAGQPAAAVLAASAPR